MRAWDRRQDTLILFRMLPNSVRGGGGCYGDPEELNRLLVEAQKLLQVPPFPWERENESSSIDNNAMLVLDDD